MTVSVQSPFVTRVYTGPGVYTFQFLLYDVEDLSIVHVDTSGVQTQLDSSMYSATTLQPYPGGEVTVTTEDLPSSGRLYIKRLLPYQQTVDWINNEAFNVELLERTQDKMVMMLQQLDATMNDASSAITWRGDWLSGIPIYERDLYRAPNTNWYCCVVGHTSDVFLDDLAEGYWILALDMVALQSMIDAAALSESNASDSEDAAAISAAAALVSEGNASDSEDAAAASASAAAGSASAASDDADDAAQALSDTQDVVATISVATIVRKDADTGAVLLPPGTSAQRPATPTAGMLRYNTDLSSFEGYANGAWGTVGGGATGAVQNPVFYENDTNVTGDYTITSGKNAMSAGPITVDDGVEVTIPSGSVWTVV